MIVLDTSALSAVMHGAAAAVDRLRVVAPSDVILVAPVAAEIRFGLERLPRGSRRRRLLEDEYARIRGAVRWEDWSEEAADEFGRQKARLARLGRLIEDFDLAIGSIAIVLDAGLATLNARHMVRIRGLSVEDWSEGV